MPCVCVCVWEGKVKKLLESSTKRCTATHKNGGTGSSLSPQSGIRNQRCTCFDSGLTKRDLEIQTKFCIHGNIKVQSSNIDENAELKPEDLDGCTKEVLG